MISVILATHNGAPTLPLTLDAMAAIRLPEEAVEFIVIDNASTDETPKIIRTSVNHLTLITLHEPKKGKSFALNRGIEAATGDLLVFTDDDVLPHHGWLCAYREAAETRPDVGLFAGQVRHCWQRQPPEWLERLATEGRSYGGTPIERVTGPIKAHSFKGANFMVRRSMMNGHRFNTDASTNYGSSKNAAGGEDTRFVKELAARGVRTLYVQEAIVQHIVRPEQIGVFPVLKRYYRIGKAIANGAQETSPTNIKTIYGFPRHLIRSIATRSIRAIGDYLSGEKYKAMSLMLDVAIDAGIGRQMAFLKSSSNEDRKTS